MNKNFLYIVKREKKIPTFRDFYKIPEATMLMKLSICPKSKDAHSFQMICLKSGCTISPKPCNCQLL